MNTRQRRLSWVGVTMLVVTAVLLTAGGVSADHGVGPVHAHNSTRVRFEQYLEALEMADTGARTLGPVPAAEVTRVRFEQYREALDQMEQERAASLTRQSPMRSDHSGVRFEQYLEALKQMEQEFANSLVARQADPARTEGD